MGARYEGTLNAERQELKTYISSQTVTVSNKIRTWRNISDKTIGDKWTDIYKVKDEKKKIRGQFGESESIGSRVRSNLHTEY